MRESYKTGVSFGLTSGIITTLGLMVGLHSGTGSEVAVLGGIFTIAIADAFSDALGIHVSEEAKNGTKSKDIWESTIATLFAKFIFSMTFIVPVFLLSLDTAIIVSVVWGILMLGVFSFYIARDQKEKPLNVVMEHIAIALLVISITHYVGDWVGSVFA
ncbi:MAG: hypothetical protein JW778_03170 [Candidatus Altiarchaeota archaeon]|nr:hypothetical protein [Candidatus Altiarchaeota archaeon]